MFEVKIMDKKIGDYIKQLRKDLDMTLEEFSEILGLSKSYINQIEKNERTPAKQKIFEILFYFNEYQEIDPPLPAKEILEIFSSYKRLDKDILNKEYEDYVKEFYERLNKKAEKYNARLDYIECNKIQYPTNHERDLIELDKPYFDLEWLLTQDEFHVFYGKKYHTDTKQVHTDSLDKLSYNKISEDDKKMLKKVIDSIFENKYKKYNN